MSLIDEVASGIIDIGGNIIDNKFVEGVLAVGAVVVGAVLASGAKTMLENSTLADIGDIVKTDNRAP
jgi:hypothetical protein